MRFPFKRCVCVVLSASLFSVFDSIPLLAGSVDAVPPLPAPTGNVVHVSTEPQLQAAVQNLVSNTTILIAAGTYRLTGTLDIGNRPLVNVALRGATGRRDDVVLVGPGMRNPSYGAAPNGIWTGNGVQGVLIANLTVQEFYFHPVILNAGTAAPRLYNVRLRDGGQQLLKSNPDSAGRGNDNGIVEYSVFEFSDTSRDYYTNGVDVLGGRGWIIRHNLFRNIRAPIGQLAGPAILMWRGSRDTIVDGNTFLNCQRDIALGLAPQTPHDHMGGVVRNNFIYRESWVHGDAGINIFDSPNTRVLHNTVLTSGTYPNAIEYRFPDTTGVLIANNLVDAAIRARDGASATLQSNLTTARADMFTNAGVADLHLLPGASAALDKGVTLPDAGTDWDGDPRPSGTAPDLGADELDGVSFNNPPRVSITSPASSAVFTAPAAVSLTADADDTDGQVASVSFFVNGVLRSTDTIAPYSFVWSNVAPGSYTLTATAVDNEGAPATSAAVSISVVAPPIPGGNQARFLGTDSQTQGSWRGVYGASGYAIANDATALPSGTTVTLSGHQSYIWSESTTVVKALSKSNGSGRQAATWYSGGSFVIDLNVGAASRRVALYLMEWSPGARSQRIDIHDAASGALLTSRQALNFIEGQYLVWEVSGRVRITVTRTAGPNAVVSAVFLDPITVAPPTPGANQARFLETDSQTQGNWRGVYGASGYAIANDATALPSGTTVTLSGHQSYVWSESTTVVKALSKSNGSGRQAATWYSGGSFVIDLNVGAASRRVALYLMEWSPGARSQRIDIHDAASGALLTSRQALNFIEGQYLVWEVSGRVRITVTRTAGPNAVVSAVFLDPST